MPRTKKRTSNRGTDDAVMKLAAEICNNERKSVRSVAKEFNICHVSLTVYVFFFFNKVYLFYFIYFIVISMITIFWSKFMLIYYLTSIFIILKR